jgi:hypothetical protein
LLSIDVTGRNIVTRVAYIEQDKTPPQVTTVSGHYGERIVRQALLSPDAAFLLHRTDRKLKVVAVDRASAAFEVDLSATFCTAHPSTPSLLISFQADRIHLLDWATLNQLSPAEGIPLAGVDAALGLPGMSGSWHGRSGSAYLAQLIDVPHLQSVCVALFDASGLTAESEEVEVQVCLLPKLQARAAVGVLKSTFYFLDMKGWVCSIGLKNLRQTTHYTRHFFIPPTWHIGSDVVIALAPRQRSRLPGASSCWCFTDFWNSKRRFYWGKRRRSCSVRSLVKDVEI